MVVGEFSCPGGAGASGTIQRRRITHDAAMRTPHYLIQKNMAHRTKKLFYLLPILVYLISNYYLSEACVSMTHIIGDSPTLYVFE